MSLEWLTTSQNETGFRVERSANGGPWTIVTYLGPGSGNVHTGQLLSMTTYLFRIVAYNASGASPSGAVQVITP